ncbi:winged helix-turn-helix transcriptional regulator [Rhizomonospora bruguierae]|uniref:winged helix-turn-helix transcriptional regulator n=1 Tax=Rhizomonospora bruguierae TaxID=1581705 RepID=UPI0020BE1361|nr:helix-turn-helix domain-containing protein [Micromonospora sp. NBRC 107566]
MSPRNTDVSEQVQALCPLVQVMGDIADKWTIGILVATAHGPIRFTELERAVNGISRRMLTLNLRKLERDGLLTRKVYPTVPPKVEYTATPMAMELYDSLVGMTSWAEKHRAAIAAARASYDAHRAAAAVAS